MLQQAQALSEREEVRASIRAVIYRNMGQALFQTGNFDDAMSYFIRSYETFDDDNDKAAAAGLIAGYYLQEGKKDEARNYAEKALRLAKAPELISQPYQIMGGIAIEEGDLPKALELMTKAAEKGYWNAVYDFTFRVVTQIWTSLQKHDELAGMWPPLPNDIHYIDSKVLVNGRKIDGEFSTNPALVYRVTSLKKAPKWYEIAEEDIYWSYRDIAQQNVWMQLCQSGMGFLINRDAE